MTTHVFIVNEKSFPIHLNYLFAGTGAGQKDSQISLLADISRVRSNDTVIFYLEKIGFFGTFEISGVPFKDRERPTYLENELGKKLIYRAKIEPLSVMPKPVSEWKALDELPLYAKDVIWSLIYRKLKGGRGCTPITLQESERLIEMLRECNNGIALDLQHRENFTYNPKTVQIEKMPQSFIYKGSADPTEDVMAEMIHLDRQGRAFENHLEVYFTRNAGNNQQLTSIVGSKEQIIWLGNKVFCGVGMQKIDVFTIISDKRKNKQFNLIELKSCPAYPEIVNQIVRYVLWTSSYIHDAINSNIQPVIATRKIIKGFRKNGKPLKVQTQQDQTKIELLKFNERCISKPVRWFEFDFVDNNIVFEEVLYNT